MDKWTLNWTLLLNETCTPLFGTMKANSLEDCLTRVKDIWKCYDLGTYHNRPYVWMFTAVDEHGRTFARDWMVDGKHNGLEVQR